MDDPVSPAGVLTLLRAATGATHQELEARVEIETCIADRERYTSLLRSFFGFYRPLEDRLFAWDDLARHGVTLANRRKTPWLVADLRALGMNAGEIEALPNCASLPATDNDARRFGCLYVLEGATLGGRQISALLQNSPVPADARHFFGSYGPETGARWREFVVSLQEEAEAVGEAGRAEIVSAAQQTFSCLQEWIVAGYPDDEHPGRNDHAGPGFLRA